MIAKVYLFTNQNLYESKRYFAAHFAAALRRRGIKTTVIDAGKQLATPALVTEILREQPAFTCSFNLMWPLEEGSSHYFCDELGIPHWSILVDPPISALELTESPLSILSCVDRNDCETLRQYGFKNVFFWPHAVEAELAEQTDDRAARPYDIAFTGSCYDYKSLRSYWQLHLPKIYADVLEDAVVRVLSSDYTSLLEALMQAWQENNGAAVAKAKDKHLDFRGLFLLLDYYTRGWDRVQLIRTLAQQHPVHVFGALFKGHVSSVLGWQSYLADCPKAIVHPAMEFAATMDVMRKSKIYLNSMPFFKDGSHERILAALACGAVPVTSDSLWLREEFVDGKDLLIYTAEERETIGARVTALLMDEERRRAIAASGRQKVLTYHTWDQRVTTLLEQLPQLLKQLPRRLPLQ